MLEIQYQFEIFSGGPRKSKSFARIFMVFLNLKDLYCYSCCLKDKVLILLPWHQISEDEI